MAYRKRSHARGRVGRVSYYEHHGGWHLYYHDGGQQVRRRVADTRDEAERLAAPVQAQLAAAAPTLLAFTPLSVPELRQRFLTYHEDVKRSSLATVRRYRAATQHLVEFAAATAPTRSAHEIRADRFVAYLRGLQVHANGHPHTAVRPLRDQGVQYILEVCRSLYGFAAKMRHLPPYAPNPFADLGIEHYRVEDAKPIFVFDADTEVAFFGAADDWAFPIHFTLAKTGLRPGELAHLLIEDVDLPGGWLRVRNRPALGWRIKTGRERVVPLVAEVVGVLRRTIGARAAGPVFLRRCFAAKAAPARDEAALIQLYQRRVAEGAGPSGQPLSRERQARIARTVWREAGAVDPDLIRRSFVRIMEAVGVPGATCPKSWRHTFATLLQDANVDPLIRQITLGHRPSARPAGALGMTAVYTHTRPETHQREIERAVRLWPRALQLAQTWAQGGDI
jgi:integrase